MKNAHLTLICHAQTDAQRLGRFARPADSIRLPMPAHDTSSPHDHRLIAPELRVQQTAQALGWTSRVDDGLRDCDFGRWQGMSLKQLEAEEPDALAHWLSDPHAAPHGGESVAALCERVARWMETVAQPGRWQSVTHPMVVRAALVHVLGCPLEAFHRIDVLPLSAVHFSHYGRWRFRTA